MASRLKARIQGVLLGVLLGVSTGAQRGGDGDLHLLRAVPRELRGDRAFRRDKLGIEARFGFTDHSVTPNAVLRTSDVLSFSGRFGDLSFDLDDLAFFIGERTTWPVRCSGRLRSGCPAPAAGS